MYTLVIGNRNYSSWSLRAWLFLRESGIPFDEVRIPLFVGDWKDQLAKYSPAGRVPVLVDGDVSVWDSAAILGYLGKRIPSLSDGRCRLRGKRTRARLVRRCTPASSRFAMSCRRIFERGLHATFRSYRRTVATRSPGSTKSGRTASVDTVAPGSLATSRSLTSCMCRSRFGSRPMGYTCLIQRVCSSRQSRSWLPSREWTAQARDGGRDPAVPRTS